MKVFGTWLAGRRKFYGLTQEELAAELWMNPQTISRAERGVKLPSKNTVKRLAEFFGDDPAEVVDAVFRNGGRGLPEGPPKGPQKRPAKPEANDGAEMLAWLAESPEDVQDEVARSLDMSAMASLIKMLARAMSSMVPAPTTTAQTNPPATIDVAAASEQQVPRLGEDPRDGDAPAAPAPKPPPEPKGTGGGAGSAFPPAKPGSNINYEPDSEGARKQAAKRKPKKPGEDK